MPVPTNPSKAMTSDPNLMALRLDADRRLSTALLWAVFGGIVILALMDIRIAREPGRAAILLAFRAVWAVATLVSIRSLVTAPDRDTLDRRTSVALFVLLGGMLALSLLRPPENYAATRLQVTTVFLGYGGLPLPLRRVFSALLMFSVGCVLILLLYNVGVPAVERDSVIVAFGLSNIVGYLIARRRAELLESESVLWHTNGETRQQLAQTLADLRTLEGILPICSFCHRIRAEDGTWERLEHYVSDRSEARFSHGFCPECEAQHYPT